MFVRRLVAAALVAASLFAVAPALSHEDHEKAAPAAVAIAPGTSPMADNMDHGLMEMQGPPKPMPQRLYSWLGRWHPATVHFPIALFLVAGVLEGAALLGRRAWLTDGTRVLVGLAAISALGAAALGWFAMGLPGPAEDLTHTLHRWVGTSIAMLGLLAWWAKERSVRAGASARVLYGVTLGLVSAAILFNAFLGGALTHGMDHLRF